MRAAAAATLLLASVVVLAEAHPLLSPELGGVEIDRRQQVLARLPKEPDLLINLDPADMPGTNDLILLGKPATPAIVNGLVNSMSPEVRIACAAVLTATRDPRAIDALMDALDDPHGSVQSLAVRALGSVESQKATPRLLGLLRKPRVPAHLKDEATTALGRLGDPSAVGPLLKYFEETWDPAAQQALWDLRRHLSAAQLRRVVVGPLTASDELPPPYAVLSLSIENAGELKLKDAARPLRGLFDAQEGLQNRIIYNLGRIGDRSSIEFLKGLLDRTAEPRLLNNVAFALQRLGDDPKPFLREALADRRAYIRFNAAFVAGDLGEKPLVPELGKALKDSNDYVRSEVAVALGKIAAPESVPALEEASKERNPVVRRDALLALARIDYKKYRERVLAELVPSEVRSIREKAIAFLAERDDETVVSGVLAALEPSRHDDREVGLQLLDRLWIVDNPDATAFLLRIAAESSHRHDALRLLARMVDERARFILRQWLTNPEGEADQLLRAAGRYADKASQPHATRWLASDDARAQLYAAYALAALGEQQGAAKLLAAIEEAPLHLKQVAAQRFTELDLERVPGTEEALAKMLAHPDVYVRVYAARALLERGDQKAQQRLWSELEKRIPFITDEVLDIVERAPARVREQFLSEWMVNADAHLRREIKRIRERTAPEAGQSL